MSDEATKRRSDEGKMLAVGQRVVEAPVPVNLVSDLAAVPPGPFEGDGERFLPFVASSLRRSVASPE